MIRIRFSNAATDDLQQIVVDGIALHGPARTQQYRTRMRDSIDLLRLNPRMGRVRPEMSPDTRSIIAGVHIVFYDLIGDEIIVIRIRHQHEDWLGGSPSS